LDKEENERGPAVEDTAPSAFPLLSDEQIRQLIEQYSPTAKVDAAFVAAVRTYVRDSEDDVKGIAVEPAPESSLVLSVSGCDYSLVADGCLASAGEISLSWTGAPEGTQSYRLTYAGEIFETQDTHLDVTLPENATYQILLKALGGEGAVLGSASASLAVFPKPVVINEISWGGTDASSMDEWIELYNPTPYGISLDGFSLSGFAEGALALSGTIGSKDRYLLERGSDEVISDESADMLYGAEFELADDVGTLVLSRGETPMDETPAGGWPAGTNFDGDKSSMERYAYQEAGSDAESWNTNILIVQNGLDRDGNPVRGTPGKRNAANYLVMKDGQALPAGLVLDRSPYLVLNPLVVEAGTTFTIGEGVTLKIYGSDVGITVLGTLLAQGTAELPVILTSFSDSEHGAEIGSSVFTDPQYTWGGISILGTSEGSALDHTLVMGSEDGIFVDDSELVVADSILEDNARGIMADSSVVTLDGTRISDTANPLTSYGASVVEVTDSIIDAGVGSSQAIAAYNGARIDIASSTVSSAYGDAVTAFNGAELSVATSTVTAGRNGVAVTVFNNVSATIENSMLQGGETGSAAVAFSGSNLEIASSTLIGGANATVVSVFSGAVASIASSTVLAGENGTGIETFSDSAVLIEDTLVSGEGSGTGIHVFQSPGGVSEVVLDGSTVTGFDTGIAAFPDTNVMLQDSSIEDSDVPIADTGGDVNIVDGE
jgi:hypothetical protein